MPSCKYWVNFKLHANLPVQAFNNKSENSDYQETRLSKKLSLNLIQIHHLR